MERKKKYSLAIVGAHGLPAKYGGFCTMAEYLAEYKPDDFEVTVYSVKSEFPNGPSIYKGCHLVYLDAPARGVMAWKFHAKGIKHAINNNVDCILLCGSNGGFFLPFYKKYRSKFYLNIGGIEWRRSKYNWMMQKVVRFLMKAAVRNSGHLIADNVGMHEYYITEYGRNDSVIIAYGGDQAKKEDITADSLKKYPFLNGKFAIVIARIQPDNNTEMLLDTFKDAAMPLVYIGNWNVTDWSKEMKRKYSNDPNIYLLDPIFDIPLLNQIRSHCSLYIHGHSAGGTNPSLIEAMFLGVPLICYDNGFNNNTTFHKAMYFKTSDDIKNILNNIPVEVLEKEGETMRDLANKNYKWSKIAMQYYNYFRNCVQQEGL